MQRPCLAINKTPSFVSVHLSPPDHNFAPRWHDHRYGYDGPVWVVWESWPRGGSVLLVEPTAEGARP